MFRIAPRKLWPKFLVSPLPESRKIRRDLHSPVIGSQQVQHQGDTAISDAGPQLHAQEILEPGFDPGRFADIVHLHAAFAELGRLRGPGVQEAGGLRAERLLQDPCPIAGGQLPERGAPLTGLL